MSKLVVLLESAEMTAKDYDAVCVDLKARNKLFDAHRPSHVAFEKDGKFCVVDVWDSPESLKEFVESGLKPAFAKMGFNVPQPVVLPAHNWLGVAEEVISA
jgi:hypothetical protein